MNETPDPDTAPRVLIAAFQGWSDAGDATSEALSHLIALQGAEPLHVIGGESFVDLQLQRPKLLRDDLGNRVLEWPDTKLHGTVHRPGAPAPAEEAEAITRIDGTPVLDLFFLSGFEPSREWEHFADEVVELAEIWGVDLVVLLGSMYSDAPHSRPIITNLVAERPELRERYGAERSEYEGAAGVISAVDLALEAAGIDTVSLWVQVPHYVHSAPSPKATLAILDKLEELLDVVIPRGELFAQATDWESNINRIAANDDDMTRYIRSLEEARDEALAAETTGDALAAEFEKFLEQDSRDASGTLGSAELSGAPGAGAAVFGAAGPRPPGAGSDSRDTDAVDGTGTASADGDTGTSAASADGDAADADAVGAGTGSGTADGTAASEGSAAESEAPGEGTDASGISDDAQPGDTVEPGSDAKPENSTKPSDTTAKHDDSAERRSSDEPRD